MLMTVDVQRFYYLVIIVCELH